MNLTVIASEAKQSAIATPPEETIGCSASLTPPRHLDCFAPLAMTRGAYKEPSHHD